MNFARSGLAQFLASTAGRITRFLAGVALIAAGILIGGTWGIVLIVVGVVPLLAGLFDVCVFSALFGGPFSGPRIRALGRGSDSPAAHRP